MTQTLAEVVLDTGKSITVDVIDLSTRGACILTYPEIRLEAGSKVTFDSTPSKICWVRETSLATVAGLEFIL